MVPSTFRDWCEEATSTPHAVCEAALAHAVADELEPTYRRPDLIERRTALMAASAEKCEQLPAEVVRLPATHRSKSSAG
jgi:hypothetical protein